MAILIAINIQGQPELVESGTGLRLAASVAAQPWLVKGEFLQYAEFGYNGAVFDLREKRWQAGNFVSIN